MSMTVRQDVCMLRCSTRLLLVLQGFIPLVMADA
jgi:hypothetical protein